MSFIPTLDEKPTAKQVRESLLEAGEKLAGLTKVDHDKRDDAWAAEKRSVSDFIADADMIHKALVAAETPEYEAPTSRGPSAAFDMSRPEVQRNISDLITSDEKYKRFTEGHIGSHEAQDFQFRGNDANLIRTLITTSTSDTPAAGVWLPVAQPTPPVIQQRRLFVRDLMNVIPTTFNTMPYIREVNAVALEGGASAVAEGTPKPEVELRWTEDEAPTRKIAAWVPVTNEIIEDAPMLRGYIDQRLAYLVLLREEVQLLRGDGNSPNIKGVLSFSDVQSQTAITGDLPATVGAMIGKVGNVDGYADAAVVNVLDYWAAATSRFSTQFDHGFGGNAPAVLSGLTWGLPAVQTRAVVPGEVIVGNWRMGSTITDRQDVVLRVGNQHSTYFTENKVAILAEERLGHMCHRPDYYVYCSDLTFS